MVFQISDMMTKHLMTPSETKANVEERQKNLISEYLYSEMYSTE